MLKAIIFLAGITLVLANQGRNSCIDRRGLRFLPCPPTTNYNGGTSPIQERPPGQGNVGIPVGVKPQNPRPNPNRGDNEGPIVGPIPMPNPNENAILIDCCKIVTYSGSDVVHYEFHRGTWELVILCVTVEHGERVEIRPVQCEDGSCKIVELCGRAAFPVKLKMNTGRFTINSKGCKYSITFLATNNPESACTCPGNCQDGWTQFGDNCYKRTDIASDFHSLEDHCNSLYEGSHLASVHSYEEHIFLRNNFAQNVQGLWLGLHDVGLGVEPRGWTWTDCSPHDYQNWHYNEPNNRRSREDCLMMAKSNDFVWSDYRCDAYLQGVCKYYLPPIPPVQPIILQCCTITTYSGSDRMCYRYSSGPITIIILCAKMELEQKIQIKKYPCNDDACNIEELHENTQYPKIITMSLEDDFTFYSDGYDYSVEFMVASHSGRSCSCPDCLPGWVRRGDYCYLRTANKGGFHVIDDYCSNLHPGAHLVSIHSDEENNFVRNNFASNARNDEFWIGVHDITFGGSEIRKWTWTDCTNYDYTNWKTNEPNDRRRREDCGYVFKRQDYKWNDIVCTRNINGVCKYYSPTFL